VIRVEYRTHRVERTSADVAEHDADGGQRQLDHWLVDVAGVGAGVRA
jgi:hypothetical protein